MPQQPINQYVSGSSKNVAKIKGLRDYKVFKAFKPTSRVVKASKFPRKRHGLSPFPSDSEPRSVAGHVSRERNRVSVAQSAPSNSTLPLSRPSQSSSRRRKTSHRDGSNDKGGDSDSDSEDRDDGSGKDRGQGRVIAVQSNDEEPMDDGNSTALQREENDRVRLLQTLTKVGEAWDTIRYIRQDNKESGRRRIQLMTNLYDHYIDVSETPSRTSRTRVDVALLENQMRQRRKYLENALYGHIECKDQTVNREDLTPERLEELIQRAQLGVIQRCRAFDPYGRKWDEIPPKADQRLVGIAKNLYTAAWRYFSTQPRGPERSLPGDFELCRRYIEDVLCRDDHSSFNTGQSTIVDPFIASYFKAIVEDLGRDLILDIGQNRRREGSKLNTLTVCQRLQISRHNDHLTPSFSAWASSRVPLEQQQNILLQWNQNLQQETLSEFRRLMDSAKVTIRQEFCANIVTPGQVSLVLFKEEWPSAVKDVTPEELLNMGWILEEGKDGPHFVRLETRVAFNTRGGLSLIVKVSMDEEVLAICGSGDMPWINWDEVRFLRD